MLSKTSWIPRIHNAFCFLLEGIANSLFSVLTLSGATRCFLVPAVSSSLLHNPLPLLPPHLNTPRVLSVRFDSRGLQVSYHKCESQFLPGSITVRMKGNDVCQVPTWHLHAWVFNKDHNSTRWELGHPSKFPSSGHTQIL